MALNRYFRERGVFRLVAFICILFVIVTAIAMLLYPGGTFADSTTRGYSFLNNFFSDLGATHTTSGALNRRSMILFVSALTVVGVSLGVFFVAFTQFFVSSRLNRWLSRIASLLGSLTGICFIGVAFTPWDLYLAAHIQFVLWAFRALLAAVVIYVVAIWKEQSMPKHFAWVFTGLALLLAGYVLLLTVGPSPATPEGQIIQAIGQKIIVYFSIISILIQSLGAERLQMRSLQDQKLVSQPSVKKPPVA